MEREPGKNKKRKILIMSAPIGSGHRMAAAAMEEALLRLDNVDVVQGNVFDFFPSWLGNGFLKFYGNVLKFCPWLYALSYRWSNQGGGSLWMRNLINGILLRLGKPFIEKVKPDAVFSTHATPTGILSLYKRNYAPDLWLGVVITDFTVHRWLVCPGVDAYFVADEKLFGQIDDALEHCEGKAGFSKPVPGGNVVHNQAESKNQIGIQPALFAWGIPVRAAFAEQKDLAAARAAVRKTFGWPADAFVCLLAGGGGGMLPMEEILKSLCNSKYKNIHAVAVTGHNDVLREKLKTLREGLAAHHTTNNVSRLEILGFTDSMPELMQAADVVITKAGGVSLAECLSCGANILIYHPLPGQEQGNTAFLQKEYGVAAVTDIRQLDEYLERELRVPLTERLQRQQERQKQFGHPHAAERIASFTDGLYSC